MSSETRARSLGSSGPRVFPIALGCMGMSGMYGPSDESESLATIHAALDRGVTLLDTGDYYGAGHNELLACPRSGPTPSAALRRCTPSRTSRSSTPS